MTPEYKPTYSAVCEDPECLAYGKPLVDKGWGYPVCETAHEPIDSCMVPMNLVFLEGE